MNRYGRMALEHTRRHRPTAMAAISDPTAHFTQVGEETQAAVTRLRDALVGDRRPDETLEDYRIRASQAQAQAEELALADHVFLPTESSEEHREADPALDRHEADLEEIARMLNRVEIDG